MPVTYQEPIKGATFQSPSRSITHQAEALGVNHTEPTRGISVQPTTQGAEFISDNLHPTLENLVAHYDSRYVNGLDAANPSDESVISQWNDISGNGNHFIQATSTYQPRYRLANRNLLTYNQATAETNTTGISTSGTNCTITRSTADAKTGTASFALTTSASGNFNGGTTGGLSGTPVSPNTQYTASMSGKWSTVARNMTIEVWMYNSSGVFQTASSTAASLGSTSSWTQKSVTFTTPSDVYYVAVKAWGYSAAAAGEILYVDEFGLWQGTSTAWVEPVKTPSADRPVVQCHSRACLRAGASANWDFASGTTGQVSVYVVAAPEADPNSYCNLIHTNGWSSTNDGFYLRHRSNGNIEGVHASGVISTNHLSASGGTGSTTGNWHVYAMTINAATPLLKASCDGVVFTDTTPSTTPGDPPHNQHPLTIGTYTPGATSTLYNNLSYAEVLVYSVAHDDATRQAIERSLGSQYGITVA